jgi:hypothetical protein
MVTQITKHAYSKFHNCLFSFYYHFEFLAILKSVSLICFAHVITANITNGINIPNDPTTAVMIALMAIINEPFMVEAEPDNSLKGDNALETELG